MAVFRDARLCVIILFINYVALVVSKRSVPVKIVEAITGVPDAPEIDQVKPVYANGVEEVAEVTDGPSTTTVKINTPKFVPELSVRAIPVSPDTVVVTVDAVGGDKVDKLRILYSDDSAFKWTRVDDYNSKENYALVAGLQPSTKYVFNVSATVNNEARSVATHVLTKPACFSKLTNLSVAAKSDSRILLIWNYAGDIRAKGFIILIDNLQSDGSVRPVKQNVVFQQNMAAIDGLDSGEKYQVKVEAFDLENIGTCSGPVLFQLNAAGETTSPELAKQSDYKVVLKQVKLSPSEVKVKWAVNEGNLNHIRYFDVKLVTDRGRVVFNRRRKPTVRSETFRRLLPQTRYIVNVQTVTARGVVDNSSVEFTTSAYSSNRKPVLYLDIVEVRDNTAMVEFSSQNLNPLRVLRYRVRVKDLDNTALGDIILNQKRFIPGTPFILESLKPKRNYQVIIDALSRRGSLLLTAIANFSTSAPDKYGTPVFASSETSPQVTPDVPTSPTLRPTTIFTRRPPPTVPQSTPTTRRAPPTVPPRTLPTTAETVETTTEEPFVIVTTELSKSQIPQQGSHQGKTDISSDPVFEVTVNPVGLGSLLLTWSTQNMPAGLGDVYIIKIRKDGPQGDVVLTERYSVAPASDLTIEMIGLIGDRPYFLELDVVSTNGSVIVSASTFYMPGLDVTPFHMTSKWSDSGLSQLQSREGGSQVDDDDGSKPEINLELNPSGHNQVKINWTVVNENRRRPIAFYTVKVHQNGPEGYKVHENLLDNNQLYYTVYGLLENIRYYIQLDALDNNGRVIEYVGYTYLVPPPGHAVEPSRTSSVFNKNKVATTVGPAKQDRLFEREELVISRVEARGSNSILVEWNHAHADASKNTQGTLVRYAEFTGKVRERSWVEFAPAGQQRLIIRRLKPDTTYSIQVVPDGSDGWSKIVFVKTGPV